MKDQMQNKNGPFSSSIAFFQDNWPHLKHDTVHYNGESAQYAQYANINGILRIEEASSVSRDDATWHEREIISSSHSPHAIAKGQDLTRACGAVELEGMEMLMRKHGIVNMSVTQHEKSN